LHVREVTAQPVSGESFLHDPAMAVMFVEVEQHEAAMKEGADEE
jgi:hypothetical protein